MNADMPNNDWLGLQARFQRPRASLSIPFSSRLVPAQISELLTNEGDQVAQEKTEVSVWYDEKSFHLHARLFTKSIERVRELATIKPIYHRDTWGDDALEVHLDIGLTRTEYLNLILPPTGEQVTYRGFNNRNQQGWHPRCDFRTEVLDGEWTVEVAIPFEELGITPSDG